MLAVFKRELKSYFMSPLGFIIIAVFTLFSGMAFSMIFSSGSPAVEGVVNFMSTVVIFATPFITMRLISEDRRQKVDQLLLTSPASVTGIVMGKFLAALSLYAVGLSALLIYPLIISYYAIIDWALYLYALFGILALGAVMISVGMFISSLTESPIIAIVFTIIANLIIMFSSSFANMITVPEATGFFGTIGAFLANTAVSFLNGMNFLIVLESFGSQTFVVKDVVFFISITAAFIFLTERALEKRRWS